jgi:hypothetical protein
MSLTIIQQLTLCKAGPHGIISQLLCDVCNLLAIGLECTGALGASMRGAMIAYMPNGGVYAPPAGATVAPRCCRLSGERHGGQRNHSQR